MYSRAALRTGSRARHATTTSSASTTTAAPRYHHASECEEAAVEPAPGDVQRGRAPAAPCLRFGPPTRSVKRHVGSTPPSASGDHRACSRRTDHRPARGCRRTSRRSARRSGARPPGTRCGAPPSTGTPATAKPPTISAANSQPIPCTSLSVSSVTAPSTRSTLRRSSIQSFASAATRKTSTYAVDSGRYEASLPTYVVPTNSTTTVTADADLRGADRTREQVRGRADRDEGDEPHRLRGHHRLRTTDGEQQRGARGERRIVVEERDARHPLDRVARQRRAHRPPPGRAPGSTRASGRSGCRCGPGRARSSAPRR